MTMPTTQRPLALITGASSGIGWDLAPLFAADGHDLVLVARNAEKLEQLAREMRTKFNVAATAIPADLSDPAAPRGLFDQLRERNLSVHTLVNNAGFGSNGPFYAADEKQQLDMLQVNVVALTHLTRLFLPPLVERRAGRIMNVASTAAFQPGPLMAVYYASKAYVLSFSEAVAEELRGTGVTVTAVCPGPTRTDFHNRARVADSPLFKGSVMDSPTVARIGYAAMKRGKVIAITGWKNAVLANSVRFGPRKVVRRFVRKLNETR